ncbi:5-oxoprolinase [Deinococcus radiopugnans]|uniref:5-oxoprolinase n=1 Tax=Deinococcus radiopugnans TaxID=57497 RepID=A0A0A7KG99_9DEIO|nr:hydantoinase/oxoprolinase family protein [Deinococcus radiopugnans]AIZ45197.1 5-oxoprolinase [Deinococcus radiopugnans]
MTHNTAGTVRVATDVGGTFTDLVYFHTDPDTGAQQIITAKSDTTPPHFEQGVLNVLRRAGVHTRDIDFMAHGTTVIINALTERKGVKTALITTQGFRDCLEIARGNRPDFFNLYYKKPPPFVPRHLRREVPGRLNHKGAERSPLDLSGLPEIISGFQAEDVQAVAICLLHSYANPAHELAVLEEVRRLWPEVSVVASHQITREWREYERSSTAVLSAYVQPTAQRYLSHLQSGLNTGGFDGQLYIMQSNCGVDSLAHTQEIPITMVESGPASGFWGAAELGRLVGEPNVLALDIGGTTAKCSLIEDGHVRIMTDYWIERDRTSAGYPIMVPVVDLVEIGNGGGSVAWVDDFGKLHVGPQSAGALPGPAAYGKGGTQATTTDANIVLGRINAEYFCGGEIEADLPAVHQALDAVAARLGGSREDAARGIVRIANHNMINALKLVSLNRGHDPRDFVLVAFGGGGGMHAVALATELGMGKVLIPYAADVFSAWGMMMSDLRRDLFITHLSSFGPAQAEALAALVTQAESDALEQFAQEGIGAERVRFVRYAKLRYENQEHAVEVELPEGALDQAATEQTTASFHASYEREYTYRLDAAVEFVGLHLVSFASIGKLIPAKLPRTGLTVQQAVKGQRDVDYATEGVHQATIYDGARLEPGMAFDGPAIVESSGTTLVVHPGNHVRVDDYGNIHVQLEAHHD